MIRSYVNRALVATTSPATMRPRIVPAVPHAFDELGLDAETGVRLRAELRRLLAAAPAWRIARCVWRVTEDDVTEWSREDLAQRYRRAGLLPLVRLIRAAPLAKACVAVEAPNETFVVSIEHRVWLASGEP